MPNVFEINGAGAPIALVVPLGRDFGYALLVEQRDPSTGVWSNKDLTGYTGEGQIRASAGGEAIAELTVTISEELSIVALNLSGEYTEEMTWENGVYDVFITAPSGERYEVAYGPIVLVTR